MIVRLALLFLALFDFTCDTCKKISSIYTRTANHLSHLSARTATITKTSAAA